MDTQLSPANSLTRLRSCICYSENLNPAYPLLTSFIWQQCEIVDKLEFSWNLS